MGRIWALLLLFFALFPLQADWFRSDSLGRPLALVREPALEETEYLLRRNRNGDGRVDILYYFGTEVRRSELRLLGNGERLEIVSEGGERRESRSAGAFPVREDIYRDGILERSYRYAWEEGALRLSELYRDGERLYRQEYHRDSAGRLRTLIRFPAEGAPEVLHFSYREGRLRESWVGGYDDGRLTRFDGARAGAEIRLEGTVEIARVERDQWRDGSVERNLDREGELLSEAYFSSRGELVREVSYGNGDILREREYRYQGDRLVESVLREPGRLERKLFFYDDQNRLVGEELQVNRRLVRKVTYDENRRVEEYFRRNELILRREYDGDQLVGEESFDEP